MPRAIAILAIDRSLEPDRARFAPELRHLLDALDPSQLHAPAPIPSSFQLLKRDDRGAVFRARMMNRDVVIKATVLSTLARLKSLARISKGWRHLRNAAWLETPPRAVRIPSAAIIPRKSSGLVSIRASTTCCPLAANSSALPAVKTTAPGAYEVVETYQMDDFAKSKIAITNDELVGERDLVKDMLG